MKWYRSSRLVELSMQEGKREAKGKNKKRGERIGEKLSRRAYPLACVYAYQPKSAAVSGKGVGSDFRVRGCDGELS